MSNAFTAMDASHFAAIGGHIDAMRVTAAADAAYQRRVWLVLQSVEYDEVRVFATRELAQAYAEHVWVTRRRATEIVSERVWDRLPTPAEEAREEEAE